MSANFKNRNSHKMESENRYHVKPQDISGKGVGLVAVTGCQEGSVLASIPLSATINRNSLRQLVDVNPALKWPTTKVLANMTDIQSITLYILICHCLMANEYHDRWQQLAPATDRQYIDDVLFKTQPTAVYLWSLSIYESMAIEQTALTQSINAKLEALDSEYEKIWAEILCPLQESLTVNEYPISRRIYSSAHALVQSRVISLGSAAEDRIEIAKDCDLHLVPLIDYANHSLAPKARWRLWPAAANDASEAVDGDGQRLNASHIQLIATSDLSAGEEVCISYGEQKSNAELLFTHGFCIPNNPHSTLAIPWSFGDPCIDMWGDVKEAIMRQCRIPPIVELKSRDAKATIDLHGGILQAFANKKSLCVLILSSMTDGDFIRMKFGTDNQDQIIAMGQLLSEDNLRLLESFAGRRDIRETLSYYLHTTCKNIKSSLPAQVRLAETQRKGRERLTNQEWEALKIYCDDMIRIAGQYADGKCKIKRPAELI